MIGGFPPQPGTKEERQLLKLFKALGVDNKQTLLKFAEFLGQQEASEQVGNSVNNPQPAESSVPLPIERPADESVIKAIKRLNKTYHMIDTSLLLDKTSDLMTQHILKGRDAASVIDDLEVLFKKIYEESLSNEG